MKTIIIGFLIMLFSIIVLCICIKTLKQKEKDMEKDLEAAVKQNEINAKYNKEIKKNEEKLEAINSGSKLTNFNSGINMLHEQSEKGKQRNRKS